MLSIVFTCSFLFHRALSHNCINCSLFNGYYLDCDPNTQRNDCPSYYSCPTELVWKGCFECTSGDNPRCLTCDYGYSLSECECRQCSTSSHTCPENNTKYGEYSCYECPDNSGSFTGCVSCLNGTHLVWDDKRTKCEECPVGSCCPDGTLFEPLIYNCSTCSSDQSRCEVCDDGYRLNEAGQCVKCEGDNACCYGNDGVFENCAECNDAERRCDSCIVGAYNSTNGCVKCGEHECCTRLGITKPGSGNCSKCNDDDTCGECLDGFFLSNGVCYEINNAGNQEFFLKEILKTLCSRHEASSDSEFTQCCRDHPADRVILGTIPSCYGTVSLDKDGFITAVFVYLFFTFFHSFFSLRDLSNIGLMHFSREHIANFMRLVNLFVSQSISCCIVLSFLNSSLSSNHLNNPADVVFYGLKFLKYLFVFIHTPFALHFSQGPFQE